MNVAAFELLLQLVINAIGLPADIQALAALIQKAKQEAREVRPEELAALKLQDDESRAALDAAIAKLT